MFAQERVEVFLETLKSGGDTIIVLREGKWETKTWQLWNETDTRIQLLSKLLFLGILIDPLKCEYVRQDEAQPLPLPLAEQVPGDDVYLFQTALAGRAETIVTSDGRLVNAVTRANDYGIQLVKRDDHYHSLGM